MINVEPLIGNEKINQPRTTENHSLFHDSLSSMELRMLVSDPGFPKRWGAPTLNRERQPIIWPKFSRKLQENETNGTGGGGDAHTSCQWQRLCSIKDDPKADTSLGRHP